jgi:hypothetical protein
VAFKQKPKPPAYAKHVSQAQLELIVAMYARDKSFFSTVRSQLTPDVMQRYGAHFAAVVDIANSHYDEYDKLPPKDIFTTELNSWVENFDGDIAEHQLESADRVLAKFIALDKQSRAENRPKVVKYTKRLLEQVVQASVESLVSNKGLLSGLPELLQESIAKIERIHSIDTVDIGEPFPENLEDQEVIKPISTGIDFFDTFMKGGHVAGEVYGLCAPYGVCKTTVACQLIVNAANYYQAQQNTGLITKLPVAYYVAYEEELALVRPRFLSYAANCHKDLIAEGKWSEMSTMKKKNYKPYEKTRYKSMFDRNVKVPGELERVNTAKTQLNKNMRVVDFSGRDRNMFELSGEMENGIAKAIEKHQQSAGNPGVAMIAIDYAGAAADRHCQVYNKDPDRHLRHLLGRFPLRVSNSIAKKFDCPVWIFHQMDTKANARKAGVVPAITDVSEAKNFMENCVYGFMVGTQTKDHLAVMACVKQRRSGKREPIVIKIDGAFGRVLGTDGAYRIDRGRIVSTKDLNKVSDAAPVTRPGQSRLIRVSDIGVSFDR